MLSVGTSSSSRLVSQSLFKAQEWFQKAFCSLDNDNSLPICYFVCVGGRYPCIESHYPICWSCFLFFYHPCSWVSSMAYLRGISNIWLPLPCWACSEGEFPSYCQVHNYHCSDCNPNWGTECVLHDGLCLTYTSGCSYLLQLDLELDCVKFRGCGCSIRERTIGPTAEDLVETKLIQKYCDIP